MTFATLCTTFFRNTRGGNVQSLNSPFFPPSIGAEAGRVKWDSLFARLGSVSTGGEGGEERGEFRDWTRGRKKACSILTSSQYISFPCPIYACPHAKKLSECRALVYSHHLKTLSIIQLTATVRVGSLHKWKCGIEMLISELCVISLILCATTSW